MKERPIIFSIPMVRAILEGRKTQTRRIVKPQPIFGEDGLWRYGKSFCNASTASPDEDILLPYDCPYGKPGDRLWVRETHWLFGHYKDKKFIPGRWEEATKYESCVGFEGPYYQPEPPHWWKKIPSIHMPRIASRILLEVEDVRVERLEDITDDDIRAEGVLSDLWTDHPRGEFYTAFKALWQSINGRESWDANPWVWVITFKRLSPS